MMIRCEVDGKKKGKKKHQKNFQLTLSLPRQRRPWRQRRAGGDLGSARRRPVGGVGGEKERVGRGLESERKRKTLPAANIVECRIVSGGL